MTSSVDVTGIKCADCDTNASAYTIRRRHLCPTCFQRYISSKILKRMETYRFRPSSQVGDHQRRRLLLPLSGGVSSLVLLHVLDAQIRKQISQQGRTAYEILGVHVDVDSAERGQKRAGLDTNELVGEGFLNLVDKEPPEWWTNVAKEFEQHEFLPVVPLTAVLSLDRELKNDIHTTCGFERPPVVPATQFLMDLMSSARSATAKADMRAILLKRILVAIAKKYDCTSIIWGHSNTTLAASVLAEVAKGRGGAVPNDLADGMSPWSLNFNCPLRDLFKVELDLYLDSLSDTTRECCAETGTAAKEAPVSLRLTSIDTLLANYITGQGEKYPSIMANVVRTASKLQVQESDDLLRCRLCAMPARGTARQDVCYGCERMKQDIRMYDEPKNGNV